MSVPIAQVTEDKPSVIVIPVENKDTWPITVIRETAKGCLRGAASIPSNNKP